MNNPPLVAMNDRMSLGREVKGSDPITFHLLAVVEDVDRICLSPSKRGKFEVKSYYQRLTILTGSPFPWKSIWRVKGFFEGDFFLLMVALGKILTLDNVRKMNVVVVEWCCMCKKSGESIYHILINCEVVRDLWSSLIDLFGVDWVMPRRVRELLVSWGSGRCGNIFKVWRLTLLCLMWCIWRE
jgi:hypothetical protein